MDSDNTLGLQHALADIEAAAREARRIEDGASAELAAAAKLAPDDEAVVDIVRAAMADINRHSGSQFRRVVTGIKGGRRAGDVFEVTFSMALTPCRNGALPGSAAGAEEPAGHDCERRYSSLDEAETTVRAGLRAPAQIAAGQAKWRIEYLGGSTSGVRPLPGDVWYVGDEGRQ